MNFAALAGRVEALIRRNGQEMTLVCAGQSAPSVETGQPAVAEASVAFSGVWDSLGKHGEEGTAEAGDAVVWAAGLNIPDPSIVDRVECGQERFRVLKIETIRGGGVRMLHKLTVAVDWQRCLCSLDDWGEHDLDDELLGNLDLDEEESRIALRIRLGDL